MSDDEAVEWKRQQLVEAAACGSLIGEGGNFLAKDLLAAHLPESLKLQVAVLVQG